MSKIIIIIIIKIKIPILLLQTLLSEVPSERLSDLHNVSKRVRFKTEGKNNPVELVVRLSFGWLWKLRVFSGRHEAP